MGVARALGELAPGTRRADLGIGVVGEGAERAGRAAPHPVESRAGRAELLRIWYVKNSDKMREWWEVVELFWGVAATNVQWRSGA